MKENIVLIVLLIFFILFILYVAFDAKFDMNENGDLILWYGRKKRKFFILIKDEDL